VPFYALNQDYGVLGKCLQKNLPEFPLPLYPVPLIKTDTITWMASVILVNVSELL